MTFAEAEEYLLGLEQFGMRFGLDRMRALMAHLGEPQRRFDQIHVVGTNGKSSTVRFVAAILERHGVRTGTYTSPHLRSFRERIEVGEAPVTEGRFAEAVTRAGRAATRVDTGRGADDRVTQFEALTAAAYLELAEARVQLAAIEAGLGGRLDATNVIPSLVQVLTGVDLEHTRWLGTTVREIAEEKVAVVREGSVLVVGPDLHADALEVAERAARERGARVLTAGSGLAPEGMPAPGGFQARNFALAAAAAEAYLDEPLDPGAVGRAAAETRVAGRLEAVTERPLTLLDGAHNPAGALALAQSLGEVIAGRRPLVLVVSVLEDKQVSGLLEPLLALAEAVVFTRCANPRAIAPQELMEHSARLDGPPAEAVSEPHAALARARALAGETGAVLATGSIYLIADLKREAAGSHSSTL